MVNLPLDLYNRILDRVQSKRRIKTRHAYNYWKERKKIEGVLSNSHYEYFYTIHFGLDRVSYRDKKILDIGCGPRGSLEWADMAAERIGLDPLADAYRKLGTNAHNMKYIAKNAEEIPFSDNYFDIVCSFNSLDHVDDLDKSINEIIRVTKPAGLFLLVTDIHISPRICEPQVFSWNIVDKFIQYFNSLEIKHYEKGEGGMYESIQANIPYEHSDKSERYGVLSAKFMKKT